MTKVEIYTTPFCGYCHAAKRLLSSLEVPFAEVDVSGNADLRQEMMTRANGRHTVPQIFLDGKHVGGFDDMAALHRQGKLEPMLGR